jgi:cytidylate kinase
METSAEPSGRVVTVSATYGAGGSIVAPRVAERLGLPFLDRLIPVGSASGSEEGLNDEERAKTPLSRLVGHLVRLPSVLGTPVPEAGDIPDRDELRREVEQSVTDVVTGRGGVILGRAAAIVLAGHPGAFHVRLDGPEDRRVARALAIEKIGEATARRRQAETDRARARYVQRLYDRDPADPQHYHLVVDSTVLPLEITVELVTTAATAFWRHGGGINRRAT